MSNLPMSSYDAIIFDLDGTLWDASESCANGWNLALRQADIQGLQVSADDIRAVTGMPFSKCVSSLFSGVESVDLTSLGPLLDEAQRHETTVSGGTLYDGVETGLKKLAAQYDLFLVSNCQSWYLQTFWTHFEVRQYFVDQNCHGDSGLPKADMIAQLVTKYRLRNAIYVGDTAGDQKASRDAGIAFGYAAYGFGMADAPELSFASFIEMTHRLSSATP